MSGRLKKITLLALAGLLLVGASQVQRELNRDRDRLGLTRVQPLENAPPVLAFTTVALGGFRGLIANALWIRATELQDEDKFFEMAQLADWITKLEPHFVQVWLVQAWNMAYNISVKFKENEPGVYSDRWRWVHRGIKLLRDDGLRYNPNETLIYRELAWFFQHKMGANLDDANMYYKQEWLKEMARVFGKVRAPNLDELVNPQTDDARQRQHVLTNEFKMDPRFMKKVDDDYGPLEWRLPEAHAIYWASVGLEKAKLNPTKVNKEDLIQLRRVIYQSMHLAVQRGRLVANPYVQMFDFGPNIDIIPKANFAYEQAMVEDEKNRDHISQAHRNMIREAVYFLYEHNRIADAAKWYQYLCEKYPNKPIIDGDPNSLPCRVPLDQYAMACVRVDVSETSRDKVKAAIESFVYRAYEKMVLDEDEWAAGFRALARKAWTSYMSQIKSREMAIGLPPVEEIEKEVLTRLLDPVQSPWPFEARAALRTKLRMKPEPPPSATSTNAPPSVSTNAPVAAPSK